MVNLGGFEVSGALLVGVTVIITVALLFLLLKGPKQKKDKLSTQAIIIRFFLVLATVYIIGIILENGITDFKPGPISLFLFVGIGVAIVTRIAEGGITKESIAGMIVVAAFVITAIIILPKLVPQIFSVAVAQTQTIVEAQAIKLMSIMGV